MKTDVMMHIPDGFLSTPASLVFWLLSAVMIFVALRNAGQNLAERSLPLMGVMAAAIFAGQMLNFSVTGGTSGHLLGAALAVIFLGPWPAMIVMASVVLVQALVFQDGGVLALGANLFNMAVVGVAVAYFVTRSFNRFVKGKRWIQFAVAFIAGWLSIFIASLVASFQLAISGTSPAQIVFPAMGGIHALIGVGEGLITAAAVGVVWSARPEMLSGVCNEKKWNKGIWLTGLLLSMVLVVFAPLASSHPDGLEWVAEKLGFLEAAKNSPYEIIPDYALPGVGNEALATILAGIIGIVIVIGMIFITVRLKTVKE